MEWISVKDRLPEDFVPIIGYYYGCLYIGYFQHYKDGSGSFYGANVDDLEYFGSVRIRNWMPLPEPPKEVNT